MHLTAVERSRSQNEKSGELFIHFTFYGFIIFAICTEIATKTVATLSNRIIELHSISIYSSMLLTSCL